MKSKNWLFEAALEAGELGFAETGLIGVRKKTSSRTRVHLEATALLAIAYLRQGDIAKAEPLIREVLLNDSNITSKSGRRIFRRRIIERFETEGVFAALRGAPQDRMDAKQVQDEAGHLIRHKTEDELFEAVAEAAPSHIVPFLLRINELSKNQLPFEERKLLPPPDQLILKKTLGRTIFSATKRILWRSLCDPKSDVHKAWVNEGLGVVLNKHYVTAAIIGALVQNSIAYKALAISFSAIVIKMGIEVFCEVFAPEEVLS
ncbi:hypothetical protein ACFL2T_02680 [Elusimicrobiota bacterium]